jgi:hypothetical protein
VAAAACQHSGDDLAAQLSRGQVVDLGDVAQIVVGPVSEGGRDSNSGVIHQNVDRSGFVFHVADQGVDLLWVREVGGMGGATELGSERSNGVLGPSNERDRCSDRANAWAKDSPRPRDAPVINTRLLCNSMVGAYARRGGPDPLADARLARLAASRGAAVPHIQAIPTCYEWFAESVNP